MADYFSNQLKAVLFLEDITEGIPMRQAGGYTVQHFDYNCFRTRDKMGKPYGPSNASLMQIILKTISADGYKELYHRLNSQEFCPFTVVFNATYDEFRILNDYSDAMVANGYMVEIEELFDTQGSKKEGMMLSMKILLHSLDYLGKRVNRKLMVNH